MCLLACGQLQAANGPVQVVPSSGTVLPLGKQVMLVEFSSQSLQVYNEHQLALDIMTVGEGLHNIPIKAECVVPMVTPSTDLLDFEQCYLRCDVICMRSQIACQKSASSGSTDAAMVVSALRAHYLNSCKLAIFLLAAFDLQSCNQIMISEQLCMSLQASLQAGADIVKRLQAAMQV